LIIIFIAGISGIIIHSCCEGYAYEWVYIITENFEAEHRTRNPYEGNDSISKEYFGIRVHFFEKKLMSHIPGPFIQNSYATSCDESYPTEDSITSIDIISLYPFNETKGSGDNVSDFFIEPYYEHSIKEEIIRLNEDDFDVIDFIDFDLIDSTVIESVHQFIVQVHLSDNRILSDTTDPVNLY